MGSFKGEAWNPKEKAFYRVVSNDENFLEALDLVSMIAKGANRDDIKFVTDAYNIECWKESPFRHHLRTLVAGITNKI